MSYGDKMHIVENIVNNIVIFIVIKVKCTSLQLWDKQMFEELNKKCDGKVGLGGKLM